MAPLPITSPLSFSWQPLAPLGFAITDPSLPIIDMISLIMFISNSACMSLPGMSVMTLPWPTSVRGKLLSLKLAVSGRVNPSMMSRSLL